MPELGRRCIPGVQRSTRYALPLAFLVASVGVTGIAAQDEPGLAVPENANVFLEKSYLSPFTPNGKDLILEGYAANHYWIRNSLNDMVWRRDGGWKWVNYPISMIFLARIFDDFSSPVRTPSFILRPLYLQSLHLSRWRTGRDGRFRLVGIGLGATHYSNGQSGCTFEGQTYDRELDGCRVTDPAVYAEKSANLVNGSFSSNFFQLDFSARWGWVDNDAVLSHQFTVRLKGERHPLDFSKGGLVEGLAQEWGQNLAGVGLEAEWRRPWGILRADFWNQLRFGCSKADSDYAGQFEVSLLMHQAENFGFFARAHWGSDYYNIHFQNTDTFVQFGVMWDPGRLDQFIRRRE